MVAGLYADKIEGYFAGARPDYVDALPADPGAAILEIGCASGGTGAMALAAGKCGRYVGVELMPEAAETARGRLTEVHVGNIEALDLPFAPASFDALIMSEVLEHLTDPWGVVRRLSGYLRDGALLFASSPNVAHYSVARNLILGRWPLADHGIMDRTHLRWFTPATFRAMFEDAGFAIDSIGPIVPLGPRARLLSRLTGGRADHLLIRQTSVRGHKLPTA